MAIQEKTALLSSASLSPKHEEQIVDLKTEFLALTSMAVQVSMSTCARIALYSIDYAFLGHLGSTELAASSLSTVWTSLPLLTVWSAAAAIVTLCGQAWGAQNYVLTGIWLQMGLTISAICVIPLFIWYWCVGSLLEFSTTDVEVVRLGTRFARILSLSIWPNLAYACVRLYFQSIGIMLPTTVVGVVSIGISIWANYLLIYGCFGWNGFGFDGSALATVVASWFQPIALVSYCFFYKKLHLQAWGGWDFGEFSRERMKTFIGIAIPLALNSLVSNLANSALALVAAKLGSDVIAANAVISGFWRLLWALFWGFGSATQIRVANYLGAGKPRAAIQLGKLGFMCTFVCVLALATIAVSMKEDIFRLYTNDDDLLRLCMLVQPIFITAFMIESIELLSAAILTAMGQVNITAWTSTFATWCVELPFAYFGGVVFGMGFQALWYSICLMEVVKLSVYLYTLIKTDWACMARIAQEKMEVAQETDDPEQLAEKAFTEALAEGGNTPFGGNTGLPSPVTPLLTPRDTHLHQWATTPKSSFSHIEESA